MPKKHTIIMVSETHWDREWYRTFQGFRMRLVRLIDKLLHILDTDPEYKTFTLDGQTIVLEDYLEIRPENRQRLERYIKEGRIMVGPWYVLCDEFLISGEALIRNLMLGHKIANQFGKVMKAGYVPDPFGHIAQLPQILQGFGLNSFIFTRGLGDEGEELGSEFLWEAPDGTPVLAIHQTGGYGNAAGFGYVSVDVAGTAKEPISLEKALQTTQNLREWLGKYATTNNLLFNNGIDHYEPQPELPEMLKYVNSQLKDAEIIHGTFEDFVARVQAASPKLKIYKGELRGGRYAPLLSGTLSTRIYLKQANDHTQRMLTSYAEPFSALAWLLGGEYKATFLWQAWKYCISNHPHDSICGCSVDQVHAEMIPRFQQAQQIAQELINESLEYAVNKIDTMPAEEKAEAEPLVVFNPLGWARSDIVKAEIQLPLDLGEKPKGYVLKDATGKIVPLQVSQLKISEDQWGIPPDKRTLNFAISFIAQDVPSVGYKTYFLIPREHQTYETALQVGPNTVENEFFKVKIEADGNLTVMDKATGHTYRNFNLFEDAEDAGDEYDYSHVHNTKVITTVGERARISLVESGPVRITYQIDINWQLPKSLTDDRMGRSEKMVNCPLTCWVSLYPGIPTIDIHIRFINNVCDHRLRALFPTDISTEYALAASTFDVTRRKLKLPTAEGWSQKPVPTQPQQTWVAVSNDKHGLAIINQGLPEYEARKDTDGVTLCLTLLRAVGWLSRDDMLIRPYHVGPKIATPQAQCLGMHEFRYSIMPYTGHWEEALVWQAAHNFNTPLQTFFTNQHKGELPKENSFLSLEPSNLVISTIKKTENRESLIVRFYNTTPKETSGKLMTYKPLREAFFTNLNEERISKLSVTNSNRLELKVKGFQIVTLELVF